MFYRNLQETILESEVDEQESDEDGDGTENVVPRLTVTRHSFRCPLYDALSALKNAGMQVDDDLQIESENAEMTTEPPAKPLSSPVTVLCHDIELLLKKLGYALHRGDIYKKVSGAKYSFAFMCNVKTFLNSLMGNDSFKDRLIKHITRVLPILSDPDNCVIRQLEIDQDLVEVNGGCLWSFRRRMFLEDALEEGDIGHKSPRAFVPYDRNKEPEPKYFEEILRNSLDDEHVARFCQDFLGLFRPKGHKQPVPCLIGAANSGKTSLFAPVFQIVPLNRIARVTKQKAFNKAMITPTTEVIFLDEAFVGLMDADDWKLLTQGGYVSNDTKWKNPEGFMSRAPMFLTFQSEPDFGVDNNEAMNKRLHKYRLKSLPRVVPGANRWLSTHAMDCIVWATHIVEADQARGGVVAGKLGHRRLRWRPRQRRAVEDYDGDPRHRE